ncbi:MAG: solI [Herbaspirillum sp.]|jgi:acyl homoserine lactone synthase|nr:solI [Herbaspirillum sp.]
MNFFSGVLKEYPAELYTELLQYRYRVFVEKLGWDVPAHNGLECDQFDREDTVHVIGRDDNGKIKACSRLLPTLKPYLLSEVFPELMGRQNLPKSAETWELSRMAAGDPDSTEPIDRPFFFSPISIKLLRFAISAAAEQGAKNFIFVGTAALALLMKRAGFNVQHASPVKTINGYRILACWIRF